MSSYVPEPALVEFIAAGTTPIYIGFGSTIVDDPEKVTALVLEAVAKIDQRAVISKGWGGLGDSTVPPNIFIIDNVPHDWLFSRVSCVVHHGDAGTTAAGIAAGKPTVIVPFSGDHQFWGNMVARAGAGPTPIPCSTLTADTLANAVKQALEPSISEQVQQLANHINSEQGAEEGAASFHACLSMKQLRCHLSPQNAAVWVTKTSQVPLSSLATAVLLRENILKQSDLKLLR